MKKVLIIYAHPSTKSFNHAILEQAVHSLETGGHEVAVLDLYALGYNPVMTEAEATGHLSEETLDYQKAIQQATDILFIFPVWWFRAPAILEGFLDKTFTPKFAYRFKPLIGKYGLPIPMLRDKKVTVFMTHGGPGLPVRTLYVNAVKYRFLLGFLSFCFNVFQCRIKQFWSVPFVSAAKRQQYLQQVDRIVKKQIPPASQPRRAGVVKQLGTRQQEKMDA